MKKSLQTQGLQAFPSPLETLLWYEDWTRIVLVILCAPMF